MRLSPSRLKVIGQFLEEGVTELAGADLMRTTKLASGSLYPILYSLEQAGVLESRWEEEEPETLGRPRRRLYCLTAVGEQVARETRAELRPFIRWAGRVAR